MTESSGLPQTQMLEDELVDEPAIALTRMSHGKSRTRLFKKLTETKTLFAFALAWLLFGSVVYKYLAHVMPMPDEDFYVYFFAAQAVHQNPHANL